MRLARHHRHLLLALVAVVPVLFFQSDSSAQLSTSTAQCCLQSTSALHTFLNPAVGEDLRFFSSDARPASIVMTMMDRREMLNFPMSLYEVRERRPKAQETDPGTGDPDAPEATGCDNAILRGLSYFYPRNTALAGPYSKSKVYPAPEYAYSGINQSNFINHYNPAKFYRHMTWTAKCQNSNDCAPIDTAADACNSLGLTDTQKAACAICLADRGFYLNPNVDTKTQLQKALYDPTAAVFSGNWLNFYPPRYVLLRLAMKRLTSLPDISRYRIGVVSNATSGDGAKVLEALRPSCNGSGAPSTSIANGADDLTFTYSSNQIAETLMNVGQYVSRKDRYKELIADSAFAMKSTMNEGGGETRSICKDCDKMYVILFSDGRGDEGNPYCTRDPVTGALPKPCLAEAKCLDKKLGAENDGDQYVDPARVGELYYLGPSKPPGPETPANACAADVADDVAGWLYRTDLNPDVGYPAKNNITTYVVGVGSARYNRMTSLQAIANKGKGTFVAATNYEALEQALNDVLQDISTRSTSFSSASVSPLQVSNGASAFLPRFRPANTSTWPGYLYRWGLFNEWAEDADKNGDGDKEDVFLVDSTSAQRIVVEDSDGNFVLQSDNTQVAEPFWEVGKLLHERGSSSRKIWTVTDNAAPFNQLDRADQVVEFKVANAALLAPYLGLTGTGFCEQLTSRLGLTTPLTQTQCAEKVIQYVRGVDVLDEDGDSDTTEDREWILGDIFHSSPAIVDPPPDKFACELGLSTQCVRTLYSQDLQVTPTPLAQYTATDGSKVDAYDKYRSDRKTRPRLILVGANDGMVHAFHAGAVIDPPPVPTIENPFPDTHDKGTGQEQWAFIPPDLLPKLKEMLSKHNYYVDGDPMVREVWKDSTTSGTANKKDADEFMTLAVFSERRGGTHYFALDVTDTTRDRPTFAWLFPQPCSDEATEVGETWMTLSPRAPPIGPVLFKKDGGIERTFPSGKIQSEERWLVFLQGGYDPNHNLGQGVYALDAVTGALVYKNTFGSNNNTSKFMKYPFAAPIAAADYGAGTTSQSVQDGFFDTAIASDTGGQIHVIRFGEPTVTDSSGRVTNWYMARAFENDAAEGTDDESDTTIAEPAYGVRHRHPFYFLPAVTVQADTGALRVFAGTGDRYNLRDTGAGVCRADNPAACAKYGCSWVSELELNVDGQKVTTHMHYDDFLVKHFRRKVENGSSVACSSFSGRQTNVLTNCPGNLSPGTIKDRQLVCSSALGTYSCSTPYQSLNNNAQTNTSFSTNGLGINRYYGIWAYGGIGPASSSRRLTFKDSTTAAQFDSARLRDSSLVNVTGVTADAQGNITSGTAAGPSDPGWYYEYADLGERTASGSALLAGCTLWNSMKYVGTTNTCAIGGDNEARLFQGHYITGAPTCAAAFAGARARTRSVLTPPPELAATTAISKNGQIGQTVQSFDPGAPQATSARVSTVEDVLQLVYDVEVPRELHDCRHVDGGSCP